MRWVYPVLTVLVLWWSAAGTGFDPGELHKVGNSVEFVLKRWLPPDWSAGRESVQEAAVTIQIAILGTFLGLVGAVPVSFFAARNITPYPWIYNLVRGFLSLIRAIPEIVLALVFVPAVGLKPVTGVLALAIHNFGVLGKLISELIEASDPGPREAVASTGAPGTAVVWWGVIPEIIPNVLSQAFYRLEVAVRASLVLGLVGAGGIGNLLFIHFKVFDYEKVLVDVLAIMVMVAAIDFLGAYVRSRVI